MNTKATVYVADIRDRGLPTSIGRAMPGETFLLVSIPGRCEVTNPSYPTPKHDCIWLADTARVR